MSAIVVSDQRIIDWLRELGISKPENTQRVIVDISVDSAVTVYVTHVADEKVFDLRFENGEFKIVTVDKATKEGLVDVTPRENDGYRIWAKAKAKANSP